MGAEFERLEIGFGVQTVMQEVKIKLWRNDQAQDWSIEINGLFHEHGRRYGDTIPIHLSLLGLGRRRSVRFAAIGMLSPD